MKTHMAKEVPHGTENGYKHYKCRCDACKAAHSEAGRRYREGNPDQYRRWAAANPEKIAANQKRFKEANPGYSAENSRAWRKSNPDARRRHYEENREKVLEQNRRWAEVNAEKNAENKRRYWETRPGKRAEVARAWNEANPDKVIAKSHRYRARKRSALVEDVPRLEIFERDNWQCMIPGCLYPGVPASLDVPHTDPLYASVDHAIPLSKGGLHERSNLVCAHLRCNTTKGDRLEGIA